MSQTVIISNGEEFYEIPVGDLKSARSEGFYLPHERQCTVVSNGEEIYEVPLRDVADAQRHGFRDLIPTANDKDEVKQELSIQRTKQPRKRLLGTSTVANSKSPSQFSSPSVESKQTTNGQRKNGSRASQTAKSPIERIENKESISERADVTTVSIVETIDEEMARRDELKEALKSATGMNKLNLLVALYSPTRQQLNKAGRTYGLSILVHVIAAIVLSFILLSASDNASGGAIISSDFADENDVQDVTDDAQEIKFESEVAETETAQAADPAGAVSNTIGNQTSDLLSAAASGDLGGGLDGLAKILGKGLDKQTGAGKKTSGSFFGSKQVASRFIFVIDNSLSMTKGRFETALNELAKTVMALTPQQSFYIIFYSDAAYPLFYPRTYPNLIPATKDNKRKVLYWLTTVELCLRTDCAESLVLALKLDPEVIFVLGDGAFTDRNAVQRVMDTRNERAKKVVIHTLGMEVNQNVAKNFSSLSRVTKGSYRDVGIHPLGREMAKKTPRKRNTRRGPVWGIKLK